MAKLPTIDVGRMGSFIWRIWVFAMLIQSFAWRRIKDGSFRFLAVTVGREMQVVARSFGHSFQQRTVDPIYNRSVQLSRTVEANAVIVEVRYKYILHLQIAAGMEQRNGVHEAFKRPGTEVEPQIARYSRQNVFEPRHVEAGRQHQVRQVLESHQIGRA